MKFEVRVNYPFTDVDTMIKTDEAIQLKAKAKISFSGCGVGENICSGRDLGFVVSSFDEAVKMKKRIEKITLIGLKVMVREQ